MHIYQPFLRSKSVFHLPWIAALGRFISLSRLTHSPIPFSPHSVTLCSSSLSSASEKVPFYIALWCKELHLLLQFFGTRPNSASWLSSPHDSHLNTVALYSSVVEESSISAQARVVWKPSLNMDDHVCLKVHLKPKKGIFLPPLMSPFFCTKFKWLKFVLPPDSTLLSLQTKTNLLCNCGPVDWLWLTNHDLLQRRVL